MAIKMIISAICQGFCKAGLSGKSNKGMGTSPSQTKIKWIQSAIKYIKWLSFTLHCRYREWKILMLYVSNWWGFKALIAPRVNEENIHSYKKHSFL